MGRLLQYVGVSMIAGSREYSFRVADLLEADRFFTVDIQNVDFLPGRLKYQEGPDICYRKLLSLLEGELSNSPLCLRQQVTGSDVTDYTVAGSARSKKWTEEQRAEARQRLPTRLR